MDRLSAGPLPRPSEVAVDFSGLDPALDACCRRDAEDSLKGQAKRSMLRRHDRVAAREKSRLQAPQQQLDLPGRNPHLVTVAMMLPGHHNNTAFEGCRCSYDPIKDGGQDYPALAELRTAMQRPQQELEAEFNDRDSDSDDDDDDLDAFMEGFGEGGGPSRSTTKGGARDDRNGDNDDDDNESDSDDDPLLSAVDNPEMTEWERQRRQQILQQVHRMEIARQHGYGGVHRNVHPSRVLKVAGLSLSQPAANAARRIPPSSCVIHLYDPESVASASLDLFFEHVLAPQYPGTMFVRSDGRDTVRLERSLLLTQASSSSSSHSRLGRALTTLIEDPHDWLPALLVVRNGQFVGAMCGFHSSDANWIDPSTGRVVPRAVQEWLEHSGGDDDGTPVLQREPPPADEVCHLRPEELALLKYLGQGASVDPGSNRRGALLTARECVDDDQEAYYDCGLPGCRKTYSHQHVGGGSSGDPTDASNRGLSFALGDGSGDPPASSSTADA